jgi:hypothetical protein
LAERRLAELRQQIGSLSLTEDASVSLEDVAPSVAGHDQQGLEGKQREAPGNQHQESRALLQRRHHSKRHAACINTNAIVSATTDAGGRFALHCSKKIRASVLAFGFREKPQGVEQHRWFLPSAEENLALHNGNLFLQRAEFRPR